MKKILLFLIVSTYLVVSVISAWNESLTYDEPVHINVGIDALTKKSFTADPFSPPLIGELAALPTVLGIDRVLPGSTPSEKALPSRIIIILLSMSLMIGIYHTVKKMIGEREAIASLFLFAWEPSILAHNHYITKDMGFTVFFFFAYISLLFLIKKYSIKRLLIFSVLSGLMLASKTSAVPFFLVTVCMLFILDRAFFIRFVKHWKHLLISVVISVFVLWSCYFFTSDVLIVRRDDPRRVSSQLLEIAKRTNNTVITALITFGTDVKIPLGNYLASQKNALLLQRERSPVFFRGVEYPDVRWYFLPCNLLVKLPIPLIVFIGFCGIAIAQKKLRFEQIIPFAAPCIGILIFLCSSGVRPYVRYLLPMYPFLIILGAVGLVRMLRQSMYALAGALCVWYTVGTLLYFPHVISFANVGAGYREKHYEILIDSDIDWGQGLIDAAHYMKKNSIGTLTLSYFGTDNGALYGLTSTVPYGTYKKEDICAFHEIHGKDTSSMDVTAISLSNWYYCGYYIMESYRKDQVRGVIGDSMLLFTTPKQ